MPDHEHDPDTGCGICRVLITDLTASLTTARATIARLNRRCQQAEGALGDKLTRVGLFNAGLAMYKAQAEEARALAAEGLARESIQRSAIADFFELTALMASCIACEESSDLSEHRCLLRAMALAEKHRALAGPGARRGA